jgi:tetratricopeptide (TPR) repeat protein
LTTRPADQAHREALALGHIAANLFDAPASVGRDLQLVIRICWAGIELESGFAPCWVILAEAHYVAVDYNLADEAFGKAAGLKARLTIGDQLYLAMTLWRQGNKQEALRNYQAADERRGSDPVRRTQRDAAELMGITISPSTRPSG